MNKQRDDFEDDGRTVADMDVEGMSEASSGPFARMTGGLRPLANRRRINSEFTPSDDTPEPTKEELRAYALNATLASLLIAGAFAVVFLIFVLFCVFVWFR